MDGQSQNNEYPTPTQIFRSKAHTFKDRWSVPRLLAPELKVEGKLEVNSGEELPIRSPKSASPHRVLGLHVEVDGLAVGKVPYLAEAQTHRNVFDPGAGVEDQQTRASKIQSMVEVVVGKRLECRLLRDRACASPEGVLIGEAMQLDRGQVIELQADEPSLRPARR